MDLPKEDGVYVYSEGLWQRLRIEGPFLPDNDGVYLIYFRSPKCPGCKAFDRVWIEFVKSNAPRLSTVLVQCKELFASCDDEAARDTFILYLVLATPQILVAIVEGGELRYVEREVGTLSFEELRSFMLGARERMERATEEAHEEQEEGLYVELSREKLKEVIEALKKVLVEGKRLEYLCDEGTCRIVLESG